MKAHIFTEHPKQPSSVTEDISMAAVKDAVKVRPQGEAREVRIVFDETTGKATEVYFVHDLNTYAVRFDWQGIFKKHDVTGSKVHDAEIHQAGTWTLNWHDIKKEFWSVKEGDGVRTMSGGGEKVLELGTTEDAKSRTTTTCRWSINRQKIEKAK